MVKKSKTNSADVDLLRIAHFILLNTMIFHEVLSAQRSEVKSLRKLKRDFQTGLLTQWEKIQHDINYKPIFSLARIVLEALPTGRQTEFVLAELKKIAISVVSSGVQLRHDLMGRIYHKLLLETMGGYYATYYTSVPAAVLISDLLVKTPNPAWDFGNLSEVSGLKVIDPACGSGTLLASTYSSIRDNLILHNAAPTPRELDSLHKAMMEKGLFGFDVLDYAAHLTLTTLSLQNPRSKFAGSRIRTLRNGVDKDGKVYLGSLDFLNPQSLLSVKIRPEGPTDEEEEILQEEVQPESFDCVVMNPPFSRSANPNLKFGYADPEVRSMMGSTLKALTSVLGLQGIGVAGLGAYFIALGDKLLKPGGKMGIVIPRHILSGVSWQKIRDILYSDYTIEYVASNFDPTPMAKDHGWCWSENTDLGEILVVARKLQKEEAVSPTAYVNVTSHPRNEVESLLLSQNVRSLVPKLKGTLEEEYWTELTIGNRVAGYAYKVEHEALSHNWHYADLFSHPELNGLVLRLTHETSLEPLEGHLTSKGRDIAIIKRNFAPSGSKTTFPILYGHQSSMNAVNLGSQHIGFGVPKNGRASRILHEEFSSTLLVAERPHVNTECLLAAEVSNPVLATAFWEVKLADEAFRPLLLLWLNSTYGFALALGAGANSEGPIYKIKQDHLGEILVPKSSADRLSECSSVYSRLQSQQFLPFPKEFSRASEGAGPRKEIDEFIADNFGLTKITREQYGLLATEPALTGRPRASQERTITAVA